MFRFGATVTAIACLWALDLHAATLAQLIAKTKRSESQALERQAMDLLRLGTSLSLKEGSYAESRTGSGQNFDKNTGNSFLSNIAYHSFVNSTCIQWLASEQCGRWLDAGISEHALTGSDYSPLEGLAMQKYLASYNVSNERQFRIWDIERDPNAGVTSNFETNGRFDERGLVSMRIRRDIKKSISDLSAKNAETQMATSILLSNPKAPARTAIDETDARLMASRYTKMYRNRLLANIGELRAADTGTEFLLGEDNPDCEAYYSAVQRQRSGNRERLDNQAPLDASRTPDMLTRFNRCRALRNASAYLVNAEMQGNTVRAGNKEEESMRKWRSRLNLIAMDKTGIDVNRLAKPSSVTLTSEDTDNDLAEYADGGLKIKRRVNKSNADQLVDYNRALESAARAEARVMKDSPLLAGDPKRIRKHKMQLASRSMVSINGLTPMMKGTLKPTTFAKVATDMAPRSPASEPEVRASQITVTRR